MSRLNLDLVETTNLQRVEISALKPDTRRAPVATTLLDHGPSDVISAMPFHGLKSTRFVLLWRGCRDCCNTDQFQVRCGKQANALTLIKEYIFSGSTPMLWAAGWEIDRRRSFLLTVKDLTMWFLLDQNKRQPAISCSLSSCHLGWRVRLRGRERQIKVDDRLINPSRSYCVNPAGGGADSS
jgi:hypothetical protein